MPRKRAKTDDYFVEVGKKKRCRFCSWETAAGTSRRSDHLLEKCLSAPIDVKNIIRQERRLPPLARPQPANLPPPSPSLSQPLPDDQSSTTSEPTPSVSSGMDSFVFSMKLEKQEQLSVQLCRAIYTSGAPFRMVENPHWKWFFQSLNPSFKAPSAHAVANRYLDLESQLLEKDGEQEGHDSE